MSLIPHPDRAAPTLAVRERLLADAPAGPFQQPGPGSADARVDLKLLWWRARASVAERGTPAARERLAMVESPDLEAGTIQDGTARGVAVALEEAISLCTPRPESVEPEPTELAALEHVVVTGKDLRRRREFLVASGGARIRFSRKQGVLFVDRDHDVNAADCIRIEDRRDRGTLDGFVADPDERPRLFSPAYLKPVRFEESPTRTRLHLEGRLGRRPDGFPCRLVVEGRPDRQRVTLRIAIRNDHVDHRLRLRLLGCRNPAVIASEGAPDATLEFRKTRFHIAVTLVRSCGELRVGDAGVPCPSAQVSGWIHHVLHVGGAAWDTPSKV